MTDTMLQLMRTVIPRRIRAGLGDTARTLTRWPPIGFIDWGDLRRTEPISQDWGFDRGQVIDRFYIERFLADHASWIRGRVLEVKHREYTSRFGSAVTQSDVIDLSDENPDATVIGNLAAAPHLPGDAFDCFILTQTLQLIFDAQAALGTVSRILKPDGTLLVTVPGISQMAVTELTEYGDFWRFTSMSLRIILDRLFHDVEVRAYGNVLSAASFLYGVAAPELTEEELLHADPRYEVVVAARASRPRRTDSAT